MAANLTNKYADSTILQYILCNEDNESIQQHAIKDKIQRNRTRKHVVF